MISYPPLLDSLLSKISQIAGEFGENLSLPAVVVGGCLSTGKTTLVTSLLNSPGLMLPNTPCPFFFSFQEKFQARIWLGNRHFLTGEPGEMIYFLKTKTKDKKPEKAELAFNHPLLKLCRLVDPPGIDSPFWFESPSLEDIYLGADEVIYLFHQRGIQNEDFYFLQKLKKRRGADCFQAFSFWVNCNTGKPDGTSLTSTKKALRELFGSEIPIHALNTRRAESVATLGTFLTGKIAARLLSRVETELKKDDALIPRDLVKIAALEEESAFLLGFWQLREKAARILALKKEMAALQKRQAVRIILQENNRRVLFENEPSRPLLPEERESSWMPSRIPATKEFPGERALRPFRTEGLVVTAWGPFSSGKSTFLNAVMGEQLLPAEDKPTTGYLTRLFYGKEKTAVVRFPKEVTIAVSEEIKNGLALNSQELSDLYTYLSLETNFPEIAGIEVNAGGRRQRIKKQELRELLEATRSSCQPGQRAKMSKKNNSPVSTIQLTFKNTLHLNYSLETERENFQRLLTGPLSFLVTEVEVHHPAEIFRLATFLDTPGIDSVYRRHRKICLRALEETGLLLVFIHGKQLLSKPLQKEVVEGIENRAGHLVKTGRIFFLLNFADTLNDLERERAVNFVRRHLPFSAQNPPLFMISSARALKEKDSGFERVMRQIREVASPKKTLQGACG